MQSLTGTHSRHFPFLGMGTSQASERGVTRIQRYHRHQGTQDGNTVKLDLDLGIQDAVTEATSPSLKACGVSSSLYTSDLSHGLS